MRSYLSLFRMRFIGQLQYRAVALAGVVTQVAWGGLLLLMYHAFYRSGADAFPMEFSALASYIWLQQGFLMLFNTWRLDGKVFESITGGGIAYELVRPVDLYTMWFCSDLGKRFASAMLRCIPILLLAPWLPAPFNLSLPDGPIALLCFLITLPLAACLVVAFTMFIYLSVFYTMAPGGGGVKLMGMMLVDLLAGQLIPLPFFPEWLQTILDYTPFAGMMNLPLRIYIGDLRGMDCLQGMLLQLIWLGLFLVLGKLWFYKAKQRVVVQGG